MQTLGRVVSGEGKKPFQSAVGAIVSTRSLLHAHILVPQPLTNGFRSISSISHTTEVMLSV